MINSHALYRLSYGGIYSKTPDWVYLLCVGISLFSRAVTSQVFSAPLSLTSVFGMGTGGPSASSTPTLIYALFFSLFTLKDFGDSCGNRTRVAGVRGRSLNRLTNEPFVCTKANGLLFISPCTCFGAPSGARTQDTLIKSQVLYQLS